MKFKNILLILSCLLVALLCVGSVAAIEDANIDDNNLTADSSDVEIVDESASDEKLSVSSDDSTLAEPKTIYVDDIGEVHTEMNDHTIKKAIDEANAGDTIIIKGKFYYHCHLIIDKQLTIKSEVGTILDPCSSVASSGYSGIFYITKGGSGTVIEGFNFVDDDPKLQDNSYGILVKGASGVVVRNSTFTFQTMGDAIRFENSNNALIENVSISGCDNAIKFKNSQNMNINDVEVKKSNIGINVIDSTKTVISNSTISDNKLAGIAFSGSGSDLNVIYSNITDNFNGINVTSPKNVYILSNYIAFNKRNGIYIDNPITLIEIKGNFFNQNAYWEIFNDFHVRDSAFSTKGNKLEVIDNNYMINAGSGSEDIDRPVWTQMYEYKPGYGQYSYDSAKDIYVYVGNGGDYDGHQDKMFLSYVFEINEYMHCPNTYVSPRNIWAQSGNYELEISEITQVKKGTYQVSIVDENGNVATDLSSVPVTFYLNKEGKSATPKEGDVYKTVMMKNGTATVKFDADDFKETGNVLTAVFPTPGTNIDSKVSKTLAINDDDIPGEVLETEIVVSEFTTYPYSNEFLVATLIDSNGKAIVGETLSFAIKTKVYNITTDANGKANLTIGLAKEGTHDFNITFAGSDDYYGSSAQTCVYIKKLSSQIVSSNVYMIPGRTEYYSITLRDENGNVIIGGKVTFTVNGKTYSRTTNSKGVASVGLQFTTEKTYTITIKFTGDNKYKASSKSNKIIAKYSSKDDKLITPTFTIPPGTSTYYTVTLKTGDGRAFANQKLTIVIDGKTYTRTTNANGQAKVSIKFTSLNKYKVSASYKGSKVYKPASSTGYITVAKTGTKIAAPTISKLPSESKDFTISLKTSDGKGIAKQRVDISVNGRTYTRTTNDNGQATLLMQLVREKTYPVTVSYKGTSVYKSTSATGYLIVSKADTDLECYNRTFSKNAIDDYQITLKDASGNSLADQEITYSLNGVNKSVTTDSNGKINVDVSSLNVGSYEFSANYAGDALSYNPTDNATAITIVDKTGIIFVDGDLPNDEIQNILNNAPEGSNVEFLGDYYFNISLTVSNGLNIYSKDKTILNAKENSPVFNIEADDVAISGFSLQGNSGDAVVINNANGVSIYNNSIANHLDESKIESYVDGTVNLPGYGVLISNSSDVEINQNYIEVFESGIFAEYSSDIAIENNTLRENNYGIKYGFGVANTQILNNEIVECIGLYIMTVPEGPSGYGIFLNNSAVNVTINSNHIAYNHMGISLDAKDSTGIVITQNTINDNVLEGIRFNAGYDVAENAVKPLVTDNAIYRNARGPSMMILGELSANPEGIYGGGLYNDSQKLQLDANWYGTNTLKTWDYDTGVVGYGTMCPRINTTEIKFYNVTSQCNGKYSIIFYKNGEIASNLPEFDLYVTLNRGTSKAVEVNFASTNGVAEFSFDASDFDSTKNTIEISIGSLLNSTSRVFKSLYSFEV